MVMVMMMSFNLCKRLPLLKRNATIPTFFLQTITTTITPKRFFASSPTNKKSSLLHTPVLVDEVVKGFSFKEGGVFVDATFGVGGHSNAILENIKDSVVIGIERDPTLANADNEVLKKFPGRLHLYHGNFVDLNFILKDCGIPKVDGILMDLGVCSTHVDTASRGFSFRPSFEGPLDMRMDNSQGFTAADVVNKTDEAELADLIYMYGEEGASRKIAREIVTVRKYKPFRTTTDLVNLIHRISPPDPDETKDPATRTFQALRIYVNQELACLRIGLVCSEHFLNPSGRLATISFHSLEDRIIKNYMEKSIIVQDKTPEEIRYPKDASFNAPKKEPPTGYLFQRVIKEYIKPTPKEIQKNPRCRSAKLRIFERTNNPPLYTLNVKPSFPFEKVNPTT